MKKLKLLFYILVVLSVFIIYHLSKDNKLNYVALGDSVANGLNSYNTIDYSYTDYLADYLRNKDILGRYINEYTENNTDFEKTILEILSDKQVVYNNKKINLKKELRESDIVTISIGQQMINNRLNSYYDTNTEIINIEEFKEMLLQIKKYAKNKIIVIGYYTPLLKEEYDALIKSINKEIKAICEKENVTFIDIYNEISSKSNYFPNPKSLNINIYGQREIYKKIIKSIKI